MRKRDREREQLEGGHVQLQVFCVYILQTRAEDEQMHKLVFDSHVCPAPHLAHTECAKG